MTAIGREVSFGEARDLIDELMRETGSHLFAAVAGYDAAASFGEIGAIVGAEAFLNVHRDPKKRREPFSLPKPWASDGRPRVTASERAELEASLASRSVFRD